MDNELKIKAGCVAAVLLGLGGCSVMPHFWRHTDQLTISEKTVKRSSSEGSDKYMIFTEEGQVLENTDSLLEWKWNSSDIYAKLKAGHKYEINSYGWRLPFFSSYHNIVGVTELESLNTPTNPSAGQNLETVVQEADLLGGPQKEKFVNINGQRAYLEIDGQPVDTYVKNHQ